MEKSSKFKLDELSESDFNQLSNELLKRLIVKSNLGGGEAMYDSHSSSHSKNGSELANLGAGLIKNS